MFPERRFDIIWFTVSIKTSSFYFLPTLHDTVDNNITRMASEEPSYWSGQQTGDWSIEKKWKLCIPIQDV